MFALIVLSGPQKKCQTDNVEEGILGIAHHNDLQFIKDSDVVCSSQNTGIDTRNNEECPRLGNPDCGRNRGVFTWKTNASAR